MNAPWNAPISDRFSSQCARVFSPAAAILESEKTLGTRLTQSFKESCVSEAIMEVPREIFSTFCGLFLSLNNAMQARFWSR